MRGNDYQAVVGTHLKRAPVRPWLDWAYGDDDKMWFVRVPVLYFVLHESRARHEAALWIVRLFSRKASASGNVSS